jgi:hypothetical protein
MPKRTIATILALALPAAPAGAGAAERWQAVSRTATSITGDVLFSSDRIAFKGGKSLGLTPAGTISGFAINGQVVPGAIYRLTRPEDPKLVAGNRLCGSGSPVSYLVVTKPKPTFGDKAPRSLSVFTGDAPPSSAATTCADYNYEASAP